MRALFRAGGPAAALMKSFCALSFALSLTACGSSNGPFVRPPADSIAGGQKNNPSAAGAPAEHIGSGPVKVALVLPLTQASGAPSVVGASLRNAAEMALTEAGSNDLTLIVKDDHSTPDGARIAAQEALAEGADLIIGPLFAPSVREVGRLAHGADKSVIAFSTDASTGGKGVYLLSFLVESYVNRIIDFAASKGKKSMAALIPENDYGRVAEAAFQQAAARDNIRVMTIEHYQPQTLAAGAQKIAALGDQIDALFIPEQADAMPAVSTALTTAGLSAKKSADSRNGTVE
ncbi:Extracellular ligand-binding receptor (fragment) [Methylocella tundrae]|uniref:Extracellular ligand-binding receptor n=1 Tax=Methylocella tundrae TaxID=227605 RepID=A0A4U8YXB0_METTU